MTPDERYIWFGSINVVRINSPRSVDDASTDDQFHERLIEHWIKFKFKRMIGIDVVRRRIISIVEFSSSNRCGTVIDNVWLLMKTNDEFVRRNVQLERRMIFFGVHDEGSKHWIKTKWRDKRRKNVWRVCSEIIRMFSSLIIITINCSGNINRDDHL